jgi:hypothetical protein
MSGITPGTRTRVFQRVRLRAITGDDAGAVRWARLLWYAVDDDVVHAEADDGWRINAVEGAVCTVHLQDDDGDSWLMEALVSLANVCADGLMAVLKSALSAEGWKLQSCGFCRWWQPGNIRQIDGLPVGRCGFERGANDKIDVPELLAIQSTLALDCDAWTERAGDVQPVSDAGRSELPENDGPDEVPPALPKAAESKSGGGFLSRLGARFGRGQESELQSQTWQEKLVERSGVGAGTESCFACQGRIANLGALTVETPDSDKQTYSVWRCRTCYGTYLNSWIDRWERLDNLETDEQVYRVAPADACEFLAVIDGVVGGDHPAGREHRHEQRRWFEAHIISLDSVSRQVKHGR